MKFSIKDFFNNCDQIKFSEKILKTPKIVLKKGV